MKGIEKVVGRDIKTGGIVTGVREGIGKTGNPYGFRKIEDYSGSYEFALFGNDFIDYRKYGFNGMYLLLNGKVQPRRFREGQFEFKIGVIELLPDVKDKLLENITIGVPLESVHNVFIDTMSSMIDYNNDSKTELYFEIYDNEHKNKVKFFSRGKKVNITNKLLNYINESEGIYYKINGQEPKA